ncbi:MAG: ABC transporter ATP-binding protein [Rhodocyclaceae bacterium]|nr:ABC transporter ATP-binding protein [Rhodocyclaceae bacterium]MCA3018341.1 ABC transporter ATP-binding protein [Rhodocyclaceae bacterium]MCA3021620.1 ABC transporter ATP-binding protein [Rhodocyclaceae bacterium]MCA3024220.1 ABC transporter ATP-binding protein [Rhodocyclaceae bacterium]MCA3029683.1 ABC transporter ATP-binding protein [Rhodocyclaceae bacterium]
MSLLSLNNVHVGYGGIKAVKGIQLHVDEGELVTLIGANGAGKTTALKAISGLLKPTSGDILYQGRSIVGVAPHRISQQGLALVPEGRGVFPGLTIEENLAMGAYCRNDKAGIASDVEIAYQRFPRLKERAKQTAGTLSGGEQQMLAISRALMSRPKLLLLDEPSMGLAPIMVQKIFAVVREVADSGVTILLIEQNAKLALQVSNRAYVMDGGVISFEGDSRSLLTDPRVREAYLGEAA